MKSLDDWVNGEGLCRFCSIGRLCPWSRRGRQDCTRFDFTAERDCFHYWIAMFYEGFPHMTGYNNPDDYPWKNDSSERDSSYYKERVELFFTTTFI